MYLAGSPSGDGEEAEEETESGVGWCVGSGVGWYVGSGVGWYVGSGVGWYVLQVAVISRGNAVLALGLLRAAKAAGCFCACIWWWPYTRTAQGGCCDHGGATAPPCSAYPLLYSHTLTLCTAARYRDVG